MVILFAILLTIYYCSDKVIKFQERRRTNRRAQADQSPQLTAKNVTDPKEPQSLSPSHPSTSTAPFHPSTVSELKRREPSDTTERGHENENDTGNADTANRSEQKKRLEIEISFKDLSLTLKSQNKCLLRSVTGTISPGRITAVMGPSGAGKTTVLSAIAGKTIGCKMDGSILINGDEKSIHCYKKIIGFVPQDDIVHGNLTVEENLRFSAKCREMEEKVTLLHH